MCRNRLIHINCNHKYRDISKDIHEYLSMQIETKHTLYTAIGIFLHKDKVIHTFFLQPSLYMYIQINTLKCILKLGMHLYKLQGTQ
jgi:hypothetical protein